MDSGETLNIKPWIENNGTGDVYAFIELDIPVVNNTPILTYTAAEPWNLVDSETSEDYKKNIYSYGSLSRVSAGTSVQPLMTTATFNNIKAVEDMELYLTVKAYAATMDGFDGNVDVLSPEDVWNTTVTAAGE